MVSIKMSGLVPKKSLCFAAKDKDTIDNIKSNHIKLMRNQVVLKLSSKLLDINVMNIDMAAKIENEVYLYCIDLCKSRHKPHEWSSEYFRSIYSGRLYEIMCALSVECDDHTFINKVKFESMNSKEVASMSPQDLCPKISESELSLFEKRKESKVEEKTTNRYICRKCTKRKCTYKEIIVGCADEVTKFLITCKECQYQWVSRG